MANAKNFWQIKKWYGGISRGSKSGIDGSYRVGTRLDAREDVDGFTIGRKMGKDSADVVVDRVDHMVSADVKGVIHIYGLGNDGNIYSNIGGAGWTLARTLSSGRGLGLGVFDIGGLSYLYYAHGTSLGQYGPLSRIPAWNDSLQTLTNVTDFNRYTARQPMANFLNMLCVGNGQYISTYDSTATWTAQALTLPNGSMVTSLAVIGDLLAIGTVDTLERGFVYLWDGVNDGYSAFYEVPAGGVHAIENYAAKNSLMIMAGPRLSLHTWAGGYPVSVYDMVGMDYGSYGEVYGSTTFDSLPYFAVAGYTDSSSLTQGIYAWGAVDYNYPDVMALDYTVSNSGTNLRLGAICSAGPDLYAAWESDDGAGIDKLQTIPAASCVYESLAFDADRIFQGITAYKLILNHSALVDGESISTAHKMDRASSFTALTQSETAAVGDVKSTYSITESGEPGFVQGNELEIQLTLSNAVDTRITEAEDTRVTEAGDTRTTEGGTTAPTIYSATVTSSVNEVL